MNLSIEFLKPILNAVKKYKVLLPSIGITIVAVLLFLVAASKKADVKDKMQNKSIRTAKTVVSLSNDIPSRNKPEQLRIDMNELEEEANQIRELAVQSTRRDLITYKYKIFPEPSDQSRQIYLEFGEQYRLAVERLLKSINALDAPSDAEISQQIGSPRTTGAYAGRNLRTPREEDPRIDALCLRRARDISVYANASTLAWYPFWESYEFSGKSQALEDCWDSQVAFWIYEDIIDTIKKMNRGVDNVLSAPVKRLLGVSFSGPVSAGNQDAGRGRVRTGQTVGYRDKPNYVLSLSQSSGSPSQASSVFLNDSPTGRVSDDDIDIVHFAVSVLVDNRSFLAFMEELCSEKPHSFYPGVFKEPFIRQGEPVESRHNQITILQNDMKVIDKTDSAHELYRYGKAAVIRLDLICEYQFVRDGYDVIKPEEIKEQLGQTDDKRGQGNTQDNRPGGMGMPMF